MFQERHPGDSKNYNECIRHETMRVAVCDMLEGKVPCPEALWWDTHTSNIFSSLHSSPLSARHLNVCVYVCVFVFLGVWWKSPSWNTTISTRESAKRGCIYRDRTCRWLDFLLFIMHLFSIFWDGTTSHLSLKIQTVYSNMLRKKISSNTNVTRLHLINHWRQQFIFSTFSDNNWSILKFLTIQ